MVCSMVWLQAPRADNIMFFPLGLEMRAVYVGAAESEEKHEFRFDNGPGLEDLWSMLSFN